MKASNSKYDYYARMKAKVYVITERSEGTCFKIVEKIIKKWFRLIKSDINIWFILDINVFQFLIDTNTR